MKSRQQSVGGMRIQQGLQRYDILPQNDIYRVILISRNNHRFFWDGHILGC